VFAECIHQEGTGMLSCAVNDNQVGASPEQSFEPAYRDWVMRQLWMLQRGGYATGGIEQVVAQPRRHPFQQGEQEF